MDSEKDTRPEATETAEVAEEITTEKVLPKTEQDILIEIQMNSAKKARIPDLLTLITGFVIIISITIALFVLPDKNFSEQENRALQMLPSMSTKSENKFLDRLIDGRYISEIATYLSDQFPLRDTFVGIKGITEIALLKGENNDVILAKDNYLITKDSEKTVDRLRVNIENISAFADAMDTLKVPVTLAAAGRSIDVLGRYMPSTYPLDNSISLCGSFNGLADYYPNIKRLDLITPIKTLIENGTGGQLYYKTDHHWTTKGAYYAYIEIMKSFYKEDNFDPLPLSAFAIEAASNEFYGTTWSKAGMKWIKPDTIEYFRYDGDEDCVMTIRDTGNTMQGFYDRSYLEKKDKYSSFISGNNARVDITKPLNLGDEPRPILLVIKDSFAHAVIPFLAYHYDLIILDYRYYMDSAARIVFNENVDRVLFLHNIGNISDDNIYGVPESDETESETVESAEAGMETETVKEYGILMYGVDTVLRDYRMSQYPIGKIYINNNQIDDYVIAIPTEENDTRKYYITAAESLRDIILNRSGVEITIVQTDDLTELDKYILFTEKGIPEGGFIKMATEGNNLIFRCNIGADSPGYAVNIFIDKYIRKAEGSFNFGSDYVYSDVGDNVIMLRPGQ